MRRIPCRNLILLVSILLAASALPATAQRGGSTAVECGAVIDEPGKYHLEEDLDCPLGFPPPAFCDDAAITITASGVTLNGRNHTLSGFPTGVGLRIASTTGGTVRNLAVEGFGTGVEVSGGGSHRLQGLRLVRASDEHCGTGIGLLLEATEGNTLRNSVVSFNRRWGVRIVSSRDNLLHGNEVSGNRWRTGDISGGVDLFQAEDNRIVGNDLSRNGLFGARLQESTSNALVRNLIDDTAFGWQFGTAVLLVESDENLIRQNRLDRDPPANIGSRYFGVVLARGADRNVLLGNEVENHNTGFWLTEGVQENLAERNTATTNLTLDARDDNPDCGTNTWRRNRFVTTNQSCVK